MSDNKEIFQFYEKLYFHEIDVREKLNARLQIPLTLIISLVGAIAFLLQNCSSKVVSPVAIIFFVAIGLAGCALGRATRFFIKSWHGNEYSFLPAATQSAAYLKQLLDLYAEFPDGETIAKNHFSDYIRQYYIECSSKNTACNDERVIFIHKANRWLIYTVGIAFCAFLVFYFGGLDKNLSKRVIDVSVVNPVTLVGGVMNTPKTAAPQNVQPPAPPPPPPPRLIREGIEVVKPIQPGSASNVK